MGQILLKADGVKLDIDQSYTDGGLPGRYAQGGIELQAPRPPSPIIHRRGTTFIYDDGSPVTDPAHVEHLPTRQVDPKTKRVINPKEMALAFIASQQQQSPGARKRGRPAGSNNPRRVRRHTVAKADGRDVLLKIEGTPLEAKHMSLDREP